LGVAICLFLEAYLFLKIYNRENGKGYYKKILIFIETVGLGAILVLTGGVGSSFLWYAINPILLSATLVPLYFCWAMLTLFVFTIVFMQRLIHYFTGTFQSIWTDYKIFLLVFILVTLGGQLYSHLINRLLKQNDIMDKNLEHIKALYEAAEVFSHQNNPWEIANLFASYGKTLTGANKIVVWLETQYNLNQQKKSFYAVRGARDVFPEEIWFPHLKKMFTNISQANKPLKQVITAGGRTTPATLITVKVKSQAHYFGILSAFFQGNSKAIDAAEKTLVFLANLCASALERRYFEVAIENFRLIEEKDRIAGEIHDNVTQNIFGLVYGLDILMKKGNLSVEQRKQLKLLQKTAQTTIKELRESIYDLSSMKKNKEPFVEELKKYLQELGQLNDIEVKFNYQGSYANLNTKQRKSLYRIIREATGNAVRHSRCNVIEVFLDNNQDKLVLSIRDNGMGFDRRKVAATDHTGLGLVNMKEMARCIGGELFITSEPGKGTLVACEIENQETDFARGGLLDENCYSR
jgi:NarL family two-component system sensor histidine kinase LiaS